jgi:hypothetical protein
MKSVFNFLCMLVKSLFGGCTEPCWETTYDPSVSGIVYKHPCTGEVVNILKISPEQYKVITEFEERV